MPIAITSEHNDLADSVRSLVARVAPSEVLHEALETPISNPPPYWAAAADQGLQGLHLSEAVGGQGFGILELAITLAEFGYGAVPGPFVPSAIASALIAAHDPKSTLLPGLASGETIAAYALNAGLTAVHMHRDHVGLGHAAGVDALRLLHRGQRRRHRRQRRHRADDQPVLARPEGQARRVVGFSRSRGAATVHTDRPPSDSGDLVAHSPITRQAERTLIRQCGAPLSMAPQHHTGRRRTEEQEDQR